MNTLFKRAKYSIGIKNKLNIEDGVDPKLKVIYNNNNNKQLYFQRVTLNSLH